MRKKIFFITGRKLFPQNSGDKILSYHTLKVLSGFYDVCLISISNDGDYNEEDKIQIQNLVITHNIIHEKISHPIISLFKSFVSNKTIVLTKRSKRLGIKKQIEIYYHQLNPEIVLWDHLRTSAYYFENDSNNFIIEHNNESSLLKQNATQNKNIFKKIIFNFLFIKLQRHELMFHEKMKKVIYISENDYIENPKSVLLEYLPIKFDGNNFQCTDKMQCNLLFVGSMDWHPNVTGINWFIKNVFPHLNKNINLNIVGRNIPSTFFKIRHERINFYSTVPDVKPYYKDADIIISPLLTGSGINIKILEALSFGIPIVATKYSLRGYPNINFLSPTDDPIEMAKNINYLSLNYDVRQRISDNEKLYYKNYIINSNNKLYSIIEG